MFELLFAFLCTFLSPSLLNYGVDFPFFAFHVLHALMSGLQWSPFLSVLYSRLVLQPHQVLTLYLPELIYAECRMAMLIRHTRLNVTSIYPCINPAYNAQCLLLPRGGYPTTSRRLNV